MTKDFRYHQNYLKKQRVQFAPCGSNFGHVEDPRFTKFIQDEKLGEGVIKVGQDHQE